MSSVSQPTARFSLRQWAALGVMTLAVTLLAVDATVLALAIPSLSQHLQPSSTELLWIGDIYSFVLAGLLVTMGNLADHIGRRRLLLIGTLGFGLSSLLAAFAPTATALIAARALLGLSGATIMPSTLSLVRNLFPDAKQRTTAIAIWSAGSSGGTALGPVIGGLLLEHFWWGSVFLINLPVMALVLVSGFFLLPESRNPKAQKVDIPSSVLSIATIVPLVYTVKTVAHHGLTGQAAVALAAGLTAGWIFLHRQNRLDNPLIDLQLFRRPAFTWAVISTILAVFALAGLLYFFSQYLQLVRGFSTITAGFAELPLTLASIFIIVLVGPTVSRIGQGRTLALGLAIAAAGLIGFGFAVATTSFLPLIGCLLLIGAGIGLGFAVATDTVLSAVPADRAGAASAISETGFELGAALGIALLGSLQDLGYRLHLAAANPPEHLAQAAAESLATLASQIDPFSPADQEFFALAGHAFMQAMQTTALIAAGLLLLSSLMSYRRLPATPAGDSHAH